MHVVLSAHVCTINSGLYIGGSITAVTLHGRNNTLFTWFFEARNKSNENKQRNRCNHSSTLRLVFSKFYNCIIRPRILSTTFANENFQFSYSSRNLPTSCSLLTWPALHRQHTTNPKIGTGAKFQYRCTS